MQQARFANQLAVITGASSGIGLATARRLAQEGARTHLLSRNGESLSAARATIAGAEATALDVSKVHELERFAAQLAAAGAVVDVLVVNAGVAEWALVADADEDHFDRQFATNVRGAFFTVRALAPLFGRQSAVVLVGSVASSVGVARTSVYAATKGAISALTRSLAAELLPRGVRVNAVCPGPTETAIQAKSAAGLAPEALAELGAATFARMPLKRLAAADEVAAAIAFLASSDASFIVGQELMVDGGMSAS